jgi:hypothetical protein
MTDQALHPEIDWSTAEVRGGELKVDLTGNPSKEWRKRLEAVLEHIEQIGNAWGDVKPTKRRIKVTGVVEGHEAELRHMLDASVQQTNADLAAPAVESAEAELSDADRAMTDAFRNMADAPTDVSSLRDR